MVSAVLKSAAAKPVVLTDTCFTYSMSKNTRGRALDPLMLNIICSSLYNHYCIGCV